MGLIIAALAIFALIAVIFGRDNAQGAFHAVFGTISVIVLIAITIAAPPIGLGAIGFVAFIFFCKWAEKASKEKAAREERVRQSARMSYGIGEMQKMLNVVNQASAVTNRAVPPPPPSNIVAEPQVPAIVAPTVLRSSVASIRPNLFCIHCGGKHAPGQRFCADCGAALTSS